MAADLAVIDQEQAHPMVRSEEEYRVLLHMAQKLLEGGFLPRDVNTPQKVLTIILKGRELGIPPTYALSNIAVINGKPAAGAELLLALVYRAYGGNALRIRVTTRERCLVHYKRPEWPDASELEFTIDDARLAGLNTDPWKKYPATMLRWRAISAACKIGFPEVIGGLYTPEELGGHVEINDAGETFIAGAIDDEMPALPSVGEYNEFKDQPSPPTSRPQPDDLATHPAFTGEKQPITPFRSQFIKGYNALAGKRELMKEITDWLEATYKTSALQYLTDAQLLAASAKFGIVEAGDSADVTEVEL